MNLYKILFSHTGPKDSETGIKTYVLAKNDEDVYEWIASEPDVNDDGHLFNSWKDKEDDEEEFDIYDDNYNVIGTENFKEKIIRLNGEIYDDDHDYDDAYYGITLFGWELIKENFDTNSVCYTNLVDLGVIIEI